MRFLGNIIWLLFGGLESAIGYFTGGVAMIVTIIGIPFGLQLLKLGVLCLWPFGSEVVPTETQGGCLQLLGNFIWFFIGGLWTMLMHWIFGLLLCITIIGIPWGKQHFKMSVLAIHPFGWTVA